MALHVSPEILEQYHGFYSLALDGTTDDGCALVLENVPAAGLRAALENLCYNALSFTPPGGRITLSLRCEDGYAVIAVSDTGSGIAPEDMPHIFERGFTRRADNSGEGLGLYIVRTFALEHGGSVDAESEQGRGSVFTLRLPRA